MKLGPHGAVEIRLLFFFTLGIKDPEGFGKKNRRKCVGVTITPGRSNGHYYYYFFFFTTLGSKDPEG